jgi:hypothetical protein
VRTYPKLAQQPQSGDATATSHHHAWINLDLMTALHISENPYGCYGLLILNDYYYFVWKIQYLLNASCPEGH